MKVYYSVLFVVCLVLASFSSHGAVLQTNSESKLPEAEKLYREGKFKECIPILTLILHDREKKLGSNHVSTAVILNNLALPYCAVGNYVKAEQLFLRALMIQSNSLPAVHPDTAATLNGLAFLYDSKEEHARAEPLFLRAISIREKYFGTNHLVTAVSWNHLGELYSRIGRYAEAEPLIERALRVRESQLPPDHSDTAGSLVNFARLKSELARYEEAEILYRRAYSALEKQLGSNHINVAVCLDDMAQFHEQSGTYSKSKPLLLRALGIYQKTFGFEHQNTIQCILKLANYCRMTDEHELSEKYLNFASDIILKHPRRFPGYRIRVLAGFANLNKAKGLYDVAEPLYRDALSFAETNSEPSGHEIVARLNDMGGFLVSLGDYYEGEPLLFRALQLRKKIYGSQHPRVAWALDDLAELYRKIGDYSKAESFYSSALQIKKRAYGPEHPSIATSFHNLAVLNKEMGLNTNSEPYFRDAQRIFESAYGPAHPNVAVIMVNLAACLDSQGKGDAAEKTYLQALKILDSARPNHPDQAICLNNLGMHYQRRGASTGALSVLERAASIREHSLGIGHPDTLVTLNNLGLVLHNLDRRKDAEVVADKVSRANLVCVSNILLFTSERQRFDYQRNKLLEPILPIALQNANEIALHMLRYRGLILDSLLEEQIVANNGVGDGDRQLLADNQKSRQRLFQLELELQTDCDTATHSQRLEERSKLRMAIEGNETILARKSADGKVSRRALKVTVEQVQGVLSNGTVLVELLRYKWPLGTNQWEQRYGAVILSGTEAPRWKMLGNAAAIDTNIAKYRQLMRANPRDDEFSQLLRNLYDQIWQPIALALPRKVTTVTIAPDSELSFLSFATLLTPERKFLAEEYSIRYVTSGRDLLSNPISTTNDAMVVYANPSFSFATAPVVNSTMRISPPVRSIGQHLYFRNLPGTAKEKTALEEQCIKRKQNFISHLATKASEASLRSIKSPRVLHLATHGFFLERSHSESAAEFIGLQGKGGIHPLANANQFEKAPARPRTPIVLKNPMHRSGFALAGAQNTLDSWGRGEVPFTENDGIVTAEEVASLHLWGTWLVTLSACDTGSGEARSGEGVMGLRRGFILAGAQNLLMTLWSVADKETVEIMRDFYEAAYLNNNLGLALADVQREWLVRLRKERKQVHAAVKLAGPFILNSQGPVW